MHNRNDRFHPNSFGLLGGFNKDRYYSSASPSPSSSSSSFSYFPENGDGGFGMDKMYEDYSRSRGYSYENKTKRRRWTTYDTGKPKQEKRVHPKEQGKDRDSMMKDLTDPYFVLHRLQKFVVKWERVIGEVYWAYTGEGAREFVKIEFGHPYLLNHAYELLTRPLGGEIGRAGCEKSTGKGKNEGKKNDTAPNYNNKNNNNNNNNNKNDNNKNWKSLPKRVQPWLDPDLKPPPPAPITGSVSGSPDTPAFQVYDANLDFVSSFLSDRALTPSTWLSVKDDPRFLSDVPAGQRISDCRREFLVNYDSIVQVQESSNRELYDTIPMFRIMSWDIEALPRKGHFPQPSTCPVIIVCFHVVDHWSKRVAGDAGKDRPSSYGWSFVLGNASPMNLPEGQEGRVFTYDFTEEHVMLADIHFFRTRLGQQIEIGYNTNMFDEEYISKRALALNIQGFPDYSRLPGVAAVRDVHKSRQGKSSAYMRVPGIFVYDMLNHMMVYEKFPSNSLNFVSAHFLQGKTKEEFTHDQIEDAIKTTRGRDIMTQYCYTDACLPYLIYKKVNALVSSVQYSRICLTPMQDIVDRGQQHKVMSRLLHYCRQPRMSKRKHRQMIPTFVRAKKTGEEKKITGAVVIDPKPGYYRRKLVITLDWKSQYPSIIMADNICFSTFVRLTDALALGLVEGVDFARYPEVVGIDDATGELVFKHYGGTETEQREIPCFLLKSKMEGIYPLMQEDLANFRGVVKKEMGVIGRKMESIKAEFYKPYAEKYGALKERKDELTALINDAKKKQKERDKMIEEEEEEEKEESVKDVWFFFHISVFSSLYRSLARSLSPSLPPFHVSPFYRFISFSLSLSLSLFLLKI
jgi:DNA polymerase elongation subunit (family B)